MVVWLCFCPSCALLLLSFSWVRICPSRTSERRNVSPICNPAKNETQWLRAHFMLVRVQKTHSVYVALGCPGVIRPYFILVKLCVSTAEGEGQIHTRSVRALGSVKNSYRSRGVRCRMRLTVGDGKHVPLGWGALLSSSLECYGRKACRHAQVLNFGTLTFGSARLTIVCALTAAADI